jgi:hypothetical protein
LIPPQRERHEDRVTEQRHRFRRKGAPVVLRLYFEIVDEARADEPYRADVDGVIHEGVLDAEGFLELKVPPSARQAEIFIGQDDEPYLVSLGHLDPESTPSGARGRLVNLGYDPGHGPPEDPAFRDAVRSFQRDRDLDVTGELDSATLEELGARHRD